MPLGRKVGLDPSNIVLNGEPAPLAKKGAELPPPQFSAHVYCAQTAGWIKMPLVVEVGLSPGHSVLDGDAALPPQKGGHTPNFGPCLLCQNGWMEKDATWYEGRP